MCNTLHHASKVLGSEVAVLILRIARKASRAPGSSSGAALPLNIESTLRALSGAADPSSPFEFDSARTAAEQEPPAGRSSERFYGVFDGLGGDGTCFGLPSRQHQSGSHSPIGANRNKQGDSSPLSADDDDDEF